MKYYMINDYIYLLSKEIKRQMENLLKSKNIGYGQYQTLITLKHLRKFGNVTQELLTQELNKDKSNVSRNIKKLEENGYIYYDFIDKKKIILMTKKSDEEITHLIELMQNLSDGILKNINETDLEITLKTLITMSKNIKGEV